MRIWGELHRDPYPGDALLRLWSMSFNVIDYVRISLPVVQELFK